MAADAFMHVSGGDVVEGETCDTEFHHSQGWFEITKFSWTAQSPDEDASDAPKGSKASDDNAASQRDMAVQDFRVEKFIDRASPDLFRACMKKTEFERALISVRESGAETRRPYLKLHFENVKVKSVDWALTPGDSSDDAGEETVTFTYGKMYIEYLHQLGTGKHEAPKVGGWDLIGHKPWGPTRR